MYQNMGDNGSTWHSPASLVSPGWHNAARIHECASAKLLLKVAISVVTALRKNLLLTIMSSALRSASPLQVAPLIFRYRKFIYRYRKIIYRYRKIEFSISKNDLSISKNDLPISKINLPISKIHLPISKIHLPISKNRIFDIGKWIFDIEKWFFDIEKSTSHLI